jgi:hypothetical protein
MPKTVKSGVGMMEHTQLQYNFVSDNADEDTIAFTEYVTCSSESPLL